MLPLIAYHQLRSSAPATEWPLAMHRRPSLGKYSSAAKRFVNLEKIEKSELLDRQPAPPPLPTPNPPLASPSPHSAFPLLKREGEKKKKKKKRKKEKSREPDVLQLLDPMICTLTKNLITHNAPAPPPPHTHTHTHSPSTPYPTRHPSTQTNPIE